MSATLDLMIRLPAKANYSEVEPASIRRGFERSRS